MKARAPLSHRNAESRAWPASGPAVTIQQHGSGLDALSYNLVVPCSKSKGHAPRPVLLLRGSTAEGALPHVSDGPRLWNGLVANSDRVVVAPFFVAARDIGKLARGETATFGFLRRGLPALLSQISKRLCENRPFQVIAESNGGVLAYALARQYPAMIGSLLILSSAPSNEELRLVPQLAQGGRVLPIAAFVSARDSAFLPNAKASQALLTKAGLRPPPALTVVDKKGFVHAGCEEAVGREALFEVLRAQGASLDLEGQWPAEAPTEEEEARAREVPTAPPPSTGATLAQSV